MVDAKSVVDTLQANVSSLNEASKTASLSSDTINSLAAIGSAAGGPAGDAFTAGVKGAGKGVAAGAGVGAAVATVAATAGASAAAASVVPVIGTAIGLVAGLIAGIASYFVSKAEKERKAKASEANQWWIQAMTEMYKVLKALPPPYQKRATDLLAADMKKAGVESFTFEPNNRGGFEMNLVINDPDYSKEPAMRAAVTAFPAKLKSLIPGWLNELNTAVKPPNHWKAIALTGSGLSLATAVAVAIKYKIIK